MLFPLALCWITGCDKQPDSQQRNISQELDLWARKSGARLSASLLRLRDGSCIDTAHIQMPWIIDDNAQKNTNGLGIVAHETALGIKSVPHDVVLGPSNGNVRISIQAWSMPPKEDTIVWPVAPPSIVRSNMASGKYNRIHIWNEPYGLEAFRFLYDNDERAYFDNRFLTQCRDYGSGDQIRCTVVSKDEQWAFDLKVSGSSRQALPKAMHAIEMSIETTRGQCPSTAS